MLFCAGLLLCLPLAGCGDTCIVITGVIPASTSITNPPTCNLGNANGTINLSISSAAMTSQVPTSPNLQHLFLSLRGIEAHPSAVADDDSPDWQELAPELMSRPVQIDLMSSSTADGTSCLPHLVRGTVVRAAAYRQIRLSLVSDQPSAGDAVPDQNACGSIGFNCAVGVAGQKRVLAIESGDRPIRIASDHIANGFFRVLPDTDSELSIQFNPFSSLAIPSGEAVRVVPDFTADSPASCVAFPAVP
jgi:hypothetical protein